MVILRSLKFTKKGGKMHQLPCGQQMTKIIYRQKHVVNEKMNCLFL
uniref:Uncharacterized protein n=1 Tax=Rhizophora mucronata TaxID=61149 RepID=A0A2P2PEF5_RHIMU